MKRNENGSAIITNDDGTYILSGILRDADMNIEELNKIGDMGRLIGEFSHGTDKDIISLENVSHMIRNVRVHDGLVFGNVLFLDTEKGREAFEYIVHCGGFEPRVVNGKVITWDVVRKHK